jgi:hypothetical protein
VLRDLFTSRWSRFVPDHRQGWQNSPSMETRRLRVVEATGFWATHFDGDLILDFAIKRIMRRPEPCGNSIAAPAL